MSLKGQSQSFLKADSSSQKHWSKMTGRCVGISAAYFKKIPEFLDNKYLLSLSLIL